MNAAIGQGTQTQSASGSIVAKDPKPGVCELQEGAGNNDNMLPSLTRSVSLCNQLRRRRDICATRRVASGTSGSKEGLHRHAAVILESQHDAGVKGAKHADPFDPAANRAAIDVSLAAKVGSRS